MKSFFRFVVASAIAAMFWLPADAAPPQTINYQGYLTNPSGTPITSTVSKYEFCPVCDYERR